jgi:hypothetical protein
LESEKRIDAPYSQLRAVERGSPDRPMLGRPFCSAPVSEHGDSGILAEMKGLSQMKIVLLAAVLLVLAGCSRPIHRFEQIRNGGITSIAAFDTETGQRCLTLPQPDFIPATADSPGDNLPLCKDIK